MKNISDFKNYIGSPVFQNDKCIIYKGDCIELMGLLPSAIIKLTVTSPPYNSGKEYEKILPLDADNYVFNLDAVRDRNVKYPNQKKNGKLKCNPLGKNPSDVWQFPKVTSGTNRSSKERTNHPAQFPIAVVDRIIKACSNPGDILLDPFLGSGSLAEAALNAGRLCVGFETNEEYIKIACDRLGKLT